MFKNSLTDELFEEEFNQYNQDQAFLTRKHQKKLAHNRDIDTSGKYRRLLIMKPDVVLAVLSKMGIDTTIKSLQRYSGKELIPKPKTKAAGRGLGKISEYDDLTPAEFFASHKLINEGPIRAKAEDVSKARKKALIAKDDGLGGMSLVFGEQPPKPDQTLSVYWLAHYNEALKKMNRLKPQPAKLIVKGITENE